MFYGEKLQNKFVKTDWMVKKKRIV
jgi:hypothetical protein